MIDLSAYLRRIGYDGPLDINFDTLRAVHRAHGMAVTYENLDVHLKQPLTIDPYAAYEKIVERSRGGWCFELNGVFGLALSAIGFNVTRLSADGSTPDSHLVLTVPLDGTTYVCDVGFADGPIDPYPLTEGPFTQQGFDFRIENETSGQWRLHNHRFGAAPGFLTKGPDEAAMEKRCDWLQSSPESPFVKHTTIFRRTDYGYHTLIDRTLRKITPEGVSQSEVASADNYVATLKTHFALDVPEAVTLWPIICEQHENYLRESAARKAAKEATNATESLGNL